MEYNVWTEVRDAAERGVFTQAELASRVGISASAISQLFSGAVNQPRYDTAVALVRAANEIAAERKKAA